MRKIITFICALAIIPSAILVAYRCYEQSKLNDFALRNIIALTDNENGQDGGGLPSGESSSYHYPDKSGTPKKCTIYRYFKLDGDAKVYEGATTHPDLEGKIGIEFRREEQVGLEDYCEKDGSGCNPFTCQTIAYVP